MSDSHRFHWTREMDELDDQLGSIFKNPSTTRKPKSVHHQHDTKTTFLEICPVYCDFSTEGWSDLTIKKHDKLYQNLLKLSSEGVINIETDTPVSSLPGDFIIINVRYLPPHKQTQIHILWYTSFTFIHSYKLNYFQGQCCVPWLHWNVVTNSSLTEYTHTRTNTHTRTHTHTHPPPHTHRSWYNTQWLILMRPNLRKT